MSAVKIVLRTKSAYIMNNPLSGTDPSGYCGTASRIDDGGGASPCTGGQSEFDQQLQDPDSAVIFQDKDGSYFAVTADNNGDLTKWTNSPASDNGSAGSAGAGAPTPDQIDPQNGQSGGGGNQDNSQTRRSTRSSDTEIFNSDESKAIENTYVEDYPLSSEAFSIGDQRFLDIQHVRGTPFWDDVGDPYKISTFEELGALPWPPGGKSVVDNIMRSVLSIGLPDVVLDNEIILTVQLQELRTEVGFRRIQISPGRSVSGETIISYSLGYRGLGQSHHAYRVQIFSRKRTFGTKPRFESPYDP